MARLLVGGRYRRLQGCSARGKEDRSYVSLATQNQARDRKCANISRYRNGVTRKEDGFSQRGRGFQIPLMKVEKSEQKPRLMNQGAETLDPKITQAGFKYPDT